MTHGTIFWTIKQSIACSSGVWFPLFFSVLFWKCWLDLEMKLSQVWEKRLHVLTDRLWIEGLLVWLPIESFQKKTSRCEGFDGSWCRQYRFYLSSCDPQLAPGIKILFKVAKVDRATSHLSWALTTGPHCQVSVQNFVVWVGCCKKKRKQKYLKLWW